MPKLNSYRDLTAWRRGVDLARAAYLVARSLPIEERFELSSQIRRAAVSIPANIAEGYARQYRKEYLQFLAIACGSLAELQTLLILAVKLDLVSRDQIKTAYKEAEEVGKILFSLKKSLYP
ncbi:MAG: four helix bundle protein [Fibrobacteres bacterium]|jgi:four helix bundle protein|nr:four helix bundle protein [Fibrobacterota bacterium]